MSDTSSKKILVLGSHWSGKSLLIKRLEEASSLSTTPTNDEFIFVTSTNGKTYTKIRFKRSQIIELHEVGGAMGCIWKSFYRSMQFDKILYVVDSTQPWCVSLACEQLKEIHEQTSIKSKNILLVISKANEFNSLNKTALTELIDLNSIWKGEVDIMETNARTGLNLSTLLDWLIR